MKLEDAGAQAITEMVKWVKAGSDVVGKAGGKAIDWASGQIPDLIKQFLMWRAVEAGAWMLLGIGLIVVPTLFGMWVWKISKEWRDIEEQSFCRTASIAVGVILGIVGFIMAFSNALTVLQIWVAPKVYLIQELATLIKK